MAVNPWVMLLLGISGLLVLGLVRLWRSISRLREELQSARNAIDALGNDLAALCEAGARQERKISDHDCKLQEIAEWIENLDHQDRSDRSYHGAILAVRKGAQVQDLVARYGVTRDAAELLVQLHGSTLESEG
ncbi:MAG: DUF2802 domain-containing protein [Gammaproteobacteria bacterium]